VLGYSAVRLPCSPGFESHAVRERPILEDNAPLALVQREADAPRSHPKSVPNRAQLVYCSRQVRVRDVITDPEQHNVSEHLFANRVDVVAIPRDGALHAFFERDGCRPPRLSELGHVQQLLRGPVRL